MRNIFVEVIPEVTREVIPKRNTFKQYSLRRGRYSNFNLLLDGLQNAENLYEFEKSKIERESIEINSMRKKITKELAQNAPPLSHTLGIILEAAEMMKILTIFPHLGIGLSLMGTIIELIDKKLQNKSTQIIYERKSNKPLS